MTKERCREVLEDKLGDIYWEDDKHELTDAELDKLAEFFSVCGLGRELANGTFGIMITYEHNEVVFRGYDAYQSGSEEKAKRKADKINSRGYKAEVGPEMGTYNTYVKNFFKKD